MAAIDFPNSPTSGDVFTVGSRSWKWNGTAWTSNNVTISATSPITYTAGDIAFAGIALDALTDVSASTPSSNQVLQWNGTAWVNATPVSNLDSLTDAAIADPASGQILSYNGTSWVNAAAPASGFDDFLLMGA